MVGLPIAEQIDQRRLQPSRLFSCGELPPVTPFLVPPTRMLGSNFQTFLFATISFQFPGKCFSALSGVAQVFADFLHPLEICLAATEIKFLSEEFLAERSKAWTVITK